MSRNLMRAVLLGAIVVVAGGLSGCTPAEEESCNTMTTCSQSVQTCCSTDQCYYSLNGRRFNRNGTNCDSAASQLVAAACGRGADPASAAAATRSLLGEAALAAQSACRPTP
jgi:hypothetical protein